MKSSTRIRELQPSDSFSDFSLAPEDEELENFFKQSSKEYQRLSLVCTYVFVEEKRILGGISLMCSYILDDRSFVGEVIELEGDDFLGNKFPAVKISHLAVDKEYQGKGIGTQLVRFSIERSRRVAEMAGCRFVVLDADEDAIKFYADLGFELASTSRNRNNNTWTLFLDLSRRVD